MLILDGHAYAYRAFHAIRSLVAPNGAPTNAIFGFIKSFEKLCKQLGAAYALVVWDGGLSEDRLKDLPDYKAQRPEMPTGLQSQIPEMQKYLAAKRIGFLQQSGMEADDIIAGVARSLAASAEIVIASPDKDFMQLVDDRIGIVNPHDKELAVWRESDVVRKTGVMPKQIVDWLSMIGDTVDNIKGVPGIGPKTAAKLLNQYGDLDHIYESLDRMAPGVWLDNLIKNRDIVYRNRRLIGLKNPLATDWLLEEYSMGIPDEGRLAELYRQWGFHSMLKELTRHPLQQGELSI